MRRRAGVGLACLIFSFAFAALPSAANAGGPAVLVSINPDSQLQIQGQEAAMSTSIAYLQGSDEWKVTDPNATAAAGCSDAAADVVECPETGNDIDFRFGVAGGSATFASADVLLDFNSEVVTRQASDNLTAGNGVDIVTAGTAAATGPDNISTLGGADEITTGDGDDIVNGGAGNDVFFSSSNTVGGDGADTYGGGADTDRVDYTGRTSGVVADIGGGANDGVSGCPTGASCEDDDIQADVENLTGTSGIDVLTGDADPNVLTGGSSNDTLAGGTGAGPDGADKLDGGIGIGDTATYSPAGGTARADVITADMDGVADDGASGENDEVEAVENLTGGAAGDSLTGDAASNRLTGGPGTGADTLDGAGGNDNLLGGTGANPGPDGTDVYVGGETGETNGDRVLYQGRDDDLTADVGGGTDADGETIDASIEQLQGGNGDDTLSGDAQNNIVLGGDGADTIAGGVGDAPDGGDTLQGGSQDEAIDTLSLATRTTNQIFSLETGNAEGDNPDSFERLLGGSGGDNLSGDGADNVLDGGPGDDSLEGGTDAPAGDGADTFIGGGAVNADEVSYDGRLDPVFARIGAPAGFNSDGDDIRADIGNLIGGDGDDHLTGDADDNDLTGGLGDDTLAGGTGPGPDGADFFAGGDQGPNGDTVSYETRTDDIVANIGGAADGAGGCPMGPGCEGDNVTSVIDNVVGGSGSDTLTGDNDANRLTGGADPDSLFGLGEDDVLDARDDGLDSGDCGTSATSDPGDTALVDQIPDEAPAFLNCDTFDPVPTTRVTKKPKRKTTKRRAKFVFDSPTGATVFECKLDGFVDDKRARRGGPDFEPCTSPQNLTGLSRGKHTMEIRAIDGTGDPDISPAFIKWKIVRK